MAAALVALCLIMQSFVEDVASGRTRACSARRRAHCCGDGRCEGPETTANCMADCPGITTTSVCNEEPHSDSGGSAVVFGINHKTSSAQECCDKCMDHAAHPRNQKRPCNSWVFCPLPICWGLDTGWNHTFGECWFALPTPSTHAARVLLAHLHSNVSACAG
ncbi:hypothetical protein AB1Y20_003781 [Prymnesium parvum]|uniref:Apple domain-containing protein n=1 Tax=Prymnesium parvum TaxID=97485 RepID=A0AB34J5X0_PRYPA